MATTATRLITAEEFYELPAPLDGSKLELVRGEVVSMPGPGFEHGEVQGNVHGHIWTFLKSQKIGRVVVESGTRTDSNPDTVRGPDVSYYSKERVPLDLRIVKYAQVPPDLCVEVVSPSNTRKKLREKIKEYFFAGVRAVWIVEPEDRSVTILLAPDEGRTIYETGTLDGGEVLPGFTCKVIELFS